MAALHRSRPTSPTSLRSIGAATLTLAGLIALVQTDIKRVIAYSTMSQIGYMFCAVGIGAYSAASSTCSRTPSSRRSCSSGPAS